jgi:hypothetical protein
MFVNPPLQRSPTHIGNSTLTYARTAVSNSAATGCAPTQAEIIAIRSHSQISGTRLSRIRLLVISSRKANRRLPPLLRVALIRRPLWSRLQLSNRKVRRLRQLRHLLWLHHRRDQRQFNRHPRIQKRARLIQARNALLGRLCLISSRLGAPRAI